MVFTSFSFLAFLAAAVLIYYLIPMRRYRELLPSGKRVNARRHTGALHPRGIVLLLISVVFYLFAGWQKLIFVLITALFAWLCSRWMAGIYTQMNKQAAELTDRKEKMALQGSYRKRCRRVATFAVVVVLLIYGYCKYFPALLSAANEILTGLGRGAVSAWDVIVPLGLSYYTLSIIGYLLDVYWRKQQHEQNFLLFLLCVLYFPQILQGPIAQYRVLRKEFLKETPFSSDRLCRGIQLMLWGFFKKLVIADRLNLFVTGVVDNYQIHQGLTFWVVALLSTFQLYADFSGCMDIASGVSELFGIQIAKNFDHPFASRSVAEWWRRWHITLCAWMKDYVYFPLAVSPRLIKLSGRIKKACNAKVAKAFVTVVTLSVVWLLTGMWHGVKFCYLIWGAYYACFLIVDTVFQPHHLTARLGIDGDSTAWKRFQMVRTTLIFSLGRLITVPDDFGISLDIFRSMFTQFNPWAFWDGTLYTAGLDRGNFILSLLLIGLLLLVEQSQIKNGPIRDRIARLKLPVRWVVWYAALAGILILGIYGAGYDASSFDYMNF